eukprot:5010280-Prorocentrum_lima.AAC.1
MPGSVHRLRVEGRGRDRWAPRVAMRRETRPQVSAALQEKGRMEDWTPVVWYKYISCFPREQYGSRENR